MKVVHVHRLRGVGGSERHLLTLLPALRERGIDATFVGLDDDDPDPFYAQLDKLGVPYSRLRAPRDIDPGSPSGFGERSRGSARTSCTPIWSMQTSTAPSRQGVRRSSRPSTTTIPSGSARSATWSGCAAARAKRIIGITGALAHFNIERVGLPADKVSVVYYGLDDLPAAWGPPGGPTLPPDARILLAVSRLEEQKGLNVAIEALAEVRKRHPNVVLVVLGSGSQESALNALAAKLDVADAVTWPAASATSRTGCGGQRCSFTRLAGRASASRLLEAMLARLPIIASAVSAIPEIVVDGTTGILIPPDDLCSPPRRRSAGSSTIPRWPARTVKPGTNGH